MNGSAPGTLNLTDVRNSLKHVAFTVVAAILAPLAQGAPLSLPQMKQAALTATAAGVLTLISRWSQDNRP